MEPVIRNNAYSCLFPVIFVSYLVIAFSGQAWATWSEDPAVNTPICDIYAQHVNSDGNIQWNINGIPISMAKNDQTGIEIIGDRHGGAIIVWEDNRNGSLNTDIYALRIDTDGSVHFQWEPNGEPVCTASDHQFDPKITSDGASGAIIAWWDERNDKVTSYIQWVNQIGETQWNNNGNAVCTAENQPTNPTLTSGGGYKGAIITWQDLRSGHYDIYAQRFNEDGTARWSTDGVGICTESKHDQSNPRIIPDGSGGAIITWEDDRNSSMDIYAQRINISGVTQWSVNGEAICTQGDNQWKPILAADGSGGAIIAWEDDRSGNLSDIYAQRIENDGILRKKMAGLPWLLLLLGK